jgi:invasion protein IalB
MRYGLRLGIGLTAALFATTAAAVAQGERPAVVRPPARPPHARPAPAPTHPQAQAQTPAAAAAQPAAAPPAPVPVRTEIWNFDSWSTTCHEFEDKKKVCSAQLQVTQVNNNTRNVVLAWTIGLDAEKHAISLLQTPTGVSIAPGVEVKLGKAAPRKVPFTMCDNGRCTATLAMDRNLVRDMTAASEAEVVIYAPNGAGVQFKFALKGFEKAYAQLTR